MCHICIKGKNKRDSRAVFPDNIQEFPFQELSTRLIFFHWDNKQEQTNKRPPVLRLRSFQRKTMQTNKNLWNIKKGTNFPTVLPIFALSQHFCAVSVPQWGALTNVYIHPKKPKSDTNLFQRYVRSKNSQIYLAVSMPEASLFETSTLCLFVSLSVWTKKMKATS